MGCVNEGGTGAPGKLLAGQWRFSGNGEVAAQIPEQQHPSGRNYGILEECALPRGGLLPARQSFDPQQKIIFKNVICLL